VSSFIIPPGAIASTRQFCPAVTCQSAAQARRGGRFGAREFGYAPPPAQARRQAKERPMVDIRGVIRRGGRDASRQRRTARFAAAFTDFFGDQAV
jgi:hypothetical protein